MSFLDWSNVSNWVDDGCENAWANDGGECKRGDKMCWGVSVIGCACIRFKGFNLDCGVDVFLKRFKSLSSIGDVYIR